MDNGALVHQGVALPVPSRAGSAVDPVVTLSARWQASSVWIGWLPPGEPLTCADSGIPEQLILPFREGGQGGAGWRRAACFCISDLGFFVRPRTAWKVRGRTMLSLDSTGAAKTRKSRKAILRQPAGAYHLRLVRPPEVVTSLRSIRVRRWYSSFCGHPSDRPASALGP